MTVDKITVNLFVNATSIDLLFSGEVKFRFYMKSEYYVPERFIEKVDGMTSSLAESGLYTFFVSFSEFSRKFVERPYLNRDVGEEDDVQVLTVEQLQRPMILIFFLWALAVIIFIAEVIWIKLKNWFNRRN